MFKKIRWKFILAVTGIVFVITLLYCIAIISVNVVNTNNDAFKQTEKLLNEFGRQVESPLPPGKQDGHYFDIRSFVLFLDESNEIDASKSSINTDNFSLSAVESIKTEIIESGKEKGSVGDYYFTVRYKNEGLLIAVTDFSVENAFLRQMILSVSLIGTAGVVVSFCVICIMSAFIVRPAKEAYAKQKRFVSESSHALKTPAAVILSNSELLYNRLRKEHSDDKTMKWAQNIKEEALRLKTMTEDLTELSKIDEGVSDVERIKINLYEAVKNSVLAFDAIAFESGKFIETDLAVGITFVAEAGSIEKAVEILLDNAVKYSEEGSTVHVRLIKENERPALYVTNSCSGLEEGEKERLFERFYRGAFTRGKIPGTGIGLSLLEELCRRNGWKISHEVKNNLITFKLIL